MCGSLLSKFKTRSNKVVPASSTESLTQERVKESISVDAKTVCLALPSGKSIVSRNNILEVRPYDSTTEKSWFHSPPSAHSTACTSEKQTEPEIRCAPESEPTCVEDHAKQKPDFESTTQWNPSSNLQERKSISALLTACCVSERELRQDKIKTKNKAVADIKEVETELDSKFKDENNSESSIKEISVKPLSRSAATSQVSDGKIKNATESAICLNGGCREPGAAFIVKKDSFTCLQPTPSADQVSKSTNERDSETDEKEDQIEPDNSTNVCLECCETTCDSKRLTTKADSGSLIDCDSASGLDEKGSELVLQPVSGCDPVVRRKKNATEPATELNIECHLNAWAQEKETNTVFQSEIAIKSCGGITEKQAFTDCKPAFNRRRASFLSAGDFGCTADFVSEAGSEAGARTAPIVIASDSIAAAAAQNDSDANLEGKVGKLCCNIVTRKSFCLLEQEKEETEQNSEDTEHLPTAEIVLVNIEHKNTCLAEIASCPQLKKTEIHSKPDFYYHSAAEVMKSVPEAGDQLDVRCDSKASMRATSKNDDAVTIEKDVEKKDITIKQTQEKEVSSTDQEASGSENGGSYEKKRPAHTKSFPSASASAMATIQGEPHAAFSKPKEDTMNAHASAANEDDGRSLENDQPNQGSDFKISRRIIIKGVAKKTKEERTTEKSGLFNPSTSQRHSEPAVTPGKQEVLFERARKELEERIVKVRNSHNSWTRIRSIV